MFTTIGFAAVTVAPIFILIFIGILLRQSGLISKEFITTASKIVFRLALPAMVFSKMSKVREIPDALIGVTLLFAGVTVIVFIILWLSAGKLPAVTHGSFVQGAFRGNIAIIGLAVIENAFGLEALQAGVVILMVMMPLYNLLAVIVLSRSSAVQGGNILKQVLLNLIKNPLIWAIAIGLPFGLHNIHMPVVVQRTLNYLSQLAMPLALISIGGSLTLRGLMQRRFLWITASAVKLFVLPLIVFAGTALFGISGNVRAAVVAASACPTAVSSFAMAEAMGADGELSGEIISATTLFSVFTFTFWIVLLMS
ncbi:MAG TPA: hypothetical protein DCO79_13360 [Spirochaeta sp.]|nr:hypothetical protein [Spirochaeta sp.]